MSSNAGILVHGQINATHTSHINAQYAPNNIPTPFPLVVASVILSFIICCVAAIPATRSIDPSYTPAPPKPATKKPVTSAKPKTPRTTASSNTPPPGYSEADIELQNTTPPPYASNGILFVPDRKEPVIPPPPKEPFKFPTSKVIYYITVLYFTFRAFSAFIVGLKSLHDNTTPIAAPSVILMALISTQIMHCIISHNPITRLILALDIFLLAITFGICGYAPTHGDWWPRYGALKIAGANCAVFAKDCMTQAPHWLSVGCGDYTTPTNYDNGNGYGYADLFYLPYSTPGNLNTQGGINLLHITEETVVIFGTGWWLFVFLQLLDTVSNIKDILSYFSSRHQPTTTTAEQQPASTRPQTKPRPAPSSYQQSLYPWILTFGLSLAFLIMLMAIGSHTSQMNKKQSMTYLESFGPQTSVNFTRGTNGVVIGTEYWGGEGAWSDCFEVRAPESRDGFWGEWVRQNEEGGVVWRVAAGL